MTGPKNDRLRPMKMMKSSAQNRLSESPNSFSRGSLAVFLGALLVTAFCRPAGAQTYVLSNAWRVATGTGHIVATGDDNRGLAYSAVGNRLFVANKRTPAIDVFDGGSGALWWAARTSRRRGRRAPSP